MLHFGIDLKDISLQLKIELITQGGITVDMNYEPSNLIISEPRSLVLNWRRQPKLSLVALKFNDLLLALAECGHVSYPAKYINSMLPSLSHSDQRNKILNQLNSLVLISVKDNSQLKVYEYVRYYEGQYTWAYTSEYVCYFLCSGIILPGSISDEVYNDISSIHNMD